YTGDIFLCSEAGTTTASGVIKEVKGTDYTNRITLDGEHTSLYIRCGSVARITDIKIVYGGEGSDPGTEPGPGTDPTPGTDPDPGPGPQPGISGKYGWYELPKVVDANLDGVNDDNSDLYYAYHQFSMNGKRYRNYAVCFDAKHHCPLWVSAPRHQMYQVKNVSRSDAYKKDPDIPGEFQYYSKDTGGGCNKGHMLGSAERLCCSEANQQVFYYSNIAPQLSTGFNTGGGGWNILEDYVDSQVVRDTLYEVLGCYFEQYTDAYGKSASPKKIEFGGRSDVSCPTMFYYVLLRTKSGNSGKSVINCTASELQCVAFVRTHTNDLKGQAVTQKELMSVSDLEKITGVTYFPNIPNAPKSSFSASDWGL
ncbi:MAG: DNA/RNA non-specific endonuclease, partial [Bacteroidales bacterium]|nr:DNA/RNA non-specific endonuclease [Bacteroidales bacterium]